MNRALKLNRYEIKTHLRHVNTLKRFTKRVEPFYKSNRSFKDLKPFHVLKNGLSNIRINARIVLIEMSSVIMVINFCPQYIIR